MSSFPTWVPSDPYLRFALQFSPEEHQLRDQFAEWLPDTVIDVHCHANGSDALGELSRTTLARVHASFPAFSIDESVHLTPFLYANKNVRRIRFANPYKGINHKRANHYLVSTSPSGDAVALYGLPDDLDYTVNEIRTGEFVGLKMYPFYYEPPAEKIADYFPDRALSAAQDVGMPIILHTFKVLAKCIEEVTEIVTQYPALRVVVAHLGRHFIATEESAAAFNSLACYTNVYVDTSMITSVEVHKQALTAFGPQRVLFGTDEPFNCLRYTEYMHPNLGRRVVSTYPYRWLDEQQRREFGHLAVHAPLVHWQLLLALKQALEDLYGTGDEMQHAKHCIFYENALRVFPLQPY